MIQFYRYLSDAFDYIDAESGKPLREIFPDVHWKAYKVIVNNDFADENYIYSDKDSVIIRAVPFGGGGGNPFENFLNPGSYGAGDAALDFFTGGGWSATKYTVNGVKWVVDEVQAAIDAQAQAEKAAREARDAMNRLRKQMEGIEQKTKDDVVNIPYLRGASNTIAMGKTQPFILGTHLFVPYVLNSGGNKYRGFSTLEDGEQYYNVVLEAGFSKQNIRKIECDGINLKTFSGTEPQEGIFKFDDFSIFNNGNSLLEIAQDGEPFETAVLNDKVVENVLNDRLYKRNEDNYEPLVYTLEQNTMKANICLLLNGLCAYDKDMSKTSRTVSFKFSYSLDYADPERTAEPSWITADEVSWTDRISVQTRKEVILKLPYESIKDVKHPVAVKIESLTDKIDAKDGADQSDTYIQWVQSFIFDTEESRAAGAFIPEKIIGKAEGEASTLIGLRIKSTPQNEDKLSKISVITSGIARTWDAQKKEWSTEKTATSNPASWWLEVMTSRHHMPSRFLDDEIDLPSIGAWYEYCERKGFTCDFVLTDGMAKATLLQKILETGRGTSYESIYDKVAVIYDDVVENASGLLNEQNMIAFTYEKNMGRKVDGLQVSYIDAENGYQENKILVMYDGSVNPARRSPDAIIKPVMADGVTSWKNAYRHALFIMKSSRIRKKNCHATVGKEGFYFRLYSKYLVQHPALKIGLGNAEIKDVIYSHDELYIVGLRLYEPLTLNDSDSFNVIIQCVTDEYCTPLSASIRQYDGRTCEILFADEIPASSAAIPHRGDVLSYGYGIETVTAPMLITGIEESGSVYNLTLVDYDERIYEDTSVFPDYVPHLTQPITDTRYEVPLPSVTPDELYGNISNLVTGNNEKISIPGNVTELEAVAEEEGIQITCAPLGAGLKNSVKKFIFEIQKGDGMGWENFESDSVSFFYVFDRTADGYPETSDLAGWKVRAKAESLYNKQSAEWTETAVNTDFYGTWALSAPEVHVRVSDRTITLLCSQKSRSDSRKVYGAIRYGIRVKCAMQGDSGFYKPNVSADPYGFEDSYKVPDDSGYVLSDGVYIQTMPLKGQREENLIDTAYQFEVFSVNEAFQSAVTVINATALATSIRDIVKANEDVKQFYVGSLSAITANLGVISQGSLSGNDNNYWALSTITDEKTGKKYYQGAMKAGGEDQYLKIVPVVNGREEIVSYEIEFKVGSFSVSSTASSINGELIIQDNPDSLDRTRITPDGTYYEHRDGLEAGWEAVSKQETRGLLSRAIYSDSSMIVGNASIQERRALGHDIGRPYISSDSIIYHFDTDMNDQHGMTGYQMTAIDAPQLKGREDNTGAQVIDFTPAILAVAPYSEIGKALYGQYSLTHPLGANHEWTVDFWIQYIWAENQILFRIGNPEDMIYIMNATDEVNYNEDEGTLYNTATAESDELCYNVADVANTKIYHQGAAGSEVINLSDEPFNMSFEPNLWLHFAVVYDDDNIVIWINDRKKEFKRFSSGTYESTAVFNENLNSFILDELLIDKLHKERFTDFAEGSENKIPFASLDWRNKYMIIDHSGELKTNLFDSELFKDAVKKIIQEM